MARNDTNFDFAGWQAIARGVDSGRAPATLSPDTLSWAINATCRGGFPTCRPGWSQRTNVSDSINDAAVRLWQGGFGYVADNGVGKLLCSISGRIYGIEVSGSYPVTELTLSTNRNASDLPIAWFAQAENYAVIQNASDDAFVFDGASLSRSTAQAKGGTGVPIGGPMAYANGRLWVALAPDAARGDFYTYTAGDLAYSDGTRSAVVQFTERDYLNGGGNFAIPSSAGPIRAFVPIALQDTATGQGPLQVFTTRGCFSVNAPFDRTQWQNLTQPIQTISLLAAGAVSATSAVNVNGDIWFRASDGVRSFAIAQRDHGTWVNTPLSREVSRSLDFDTPHLLKHASAALFDNRLLVTTTPQRINSSGTNYGVAHSGIAVLDFAPISSMFDRTQPSWEGIWTGLRVLQIVPLETEPRRLFIFALDSSNDIVLYELSTSDRFDNSDNRISWVLEAPSYGFRDGGWDLKQLQYGDAWFNRVAGTVDWTARYRPDSDPIWQSWTTGQICAQISACDTTCNNFSPLVEQYRTRVRFPTPNDTADPITNKPYRHGCRFAARIEITGHCQVPQLRLASIALPEPNTGAAPNTSCTLTPLRQDCITSDDYSYETSL